MKMEELRKWKNIIAVGYRKLNNKPRRETYKAIEKYLKTSVKK